MTTESHPLLGVLVVNYGSHALLQKNLVPLMAAVPNAFVVVVDNLTDDDEREFMSALAVEHGWYLETPNGNLGFGAGMNLAAARAQELSAEHLLMLNPDATLGGQALDILRREVTQRPHTMISPTILRPDGSVFFQGADLYLASGRTRSRRRRPASGPRDRHPEVRPWLSGACWIVDVRLWSACDGFDTDYFLYWEDVDFSHQVLAAGGEIDVLGDALAVHDAGSTSRAKQVTERAKSDTYYYYNIRNRLLYARKHLGVWGRLRWAVLSPAVALEILLQGGKRQFLHSRKPMRTAIRATVDGLLLLIGAGHPGARRG